MEWMVKMRRMTFSLNAVLVAVCYFVLACTSLIE